jgi:hypothetical protein
MIQEAKDGAYQHVNTPNRQKATNRFRKLLDNYRASELQRLDDQIARTPAGPARKALVNAKKDIVAEKVGFQYQFDEAMRTPAGADVQPMYKSGVSMDPSYEGPHARPDYTISGSSTRGGGTLLHVNLKSHDLRDLTVGDARAIARKAKEQAIRNIVGNPERKGDVGHLNPNDELIISFIDQPDRATQQEMLDIMLTQDSPISEVRFGTATYRRAGSYPRRQFPVRSGGTGGAGLRSEPEPITNKSTPTVPRARPPEGPAAKGEPEGDVTRTRTPKEPETTPPKPKTTEPETTPPKPKTTQPETTPPKPKATEPQATPPKPKTTEPEITAPKPKTSVPEVQSGKDGRSTVKSGRVTVEYDPAASDPHQAVKLTEFDLSDEPSVKRGPARGAAEWAPHLTNLINVVSLSRMVLSLFAEATDESTSSKIRWVTNPLQSYLGMELDDARQEFQEQFPAASLVRQFLAVDQYQKAYADAAAKLRVPAEKRAQLAVLLALTPEKDRDAVWRWRAQHLDVAGISAEDVQAFLDAGHAYENAMIEFQGQLTRYRIPLPDMASVIGQRAALLQAAGEDFARVFWAVIRVAGAFPLTAYAALEIYNVSDVFNSFGGRMAAFATEVNLRMEDYQRIWDSQDQLILQLEEQLTKLDPARPPRGSRGR